MVVTVVVEAVVVAESVVVRLVVARVALVAVPGEPAEVATEGSKEASR